MKKMDIPFGRPWIANEDRKAVMNVLKGHILTHGPNCTAFEDEFIAMMGGGFALVNIPSAAVVTTLVRTQVLSLAMSVNTMALFAGGSFGMAVLTAILITRGLGGRQPRSIPCIAEREPASVTDN